MYSVMFMFKRFDDTTNYHRGYERIVASNIEEAIEVGFRNFKEEQNVECIVSILATCHM